MTLHRPCLLALLLCLSAAAGIDIKNNLPKDNPCADLDKDNYDDVKKDVKKVLASKVPKSINDQIAERLKAAGLKKNPKVRVDVDIARDWQSFQKQYNDDHPKSPLSDADAKARFDSLDAYTYTTEKDPQTIRVVLFCNRSFKNKVIEGNTSRVLVHELVHAKRYALLIAEIPKEKFFGDDDDEGWKKGQDPRDPKQKGHPEDHNPDFHKEVDKLARLL